MKIIIRSNPKTELIKEWIVVDGKRILVIKKKKQNDKKRNIPPSLR